ncbi:hypothetical protein PTSG_03025 [Salpingoeca rosetta]|uniref:Peptidase C39-like domain-containing protein n=1 Tax=Salpingoeca rosetta (strain ATCC 50818 / BSB-021) TaxID=946362 RepID=F2U416_SALR5|nr:uncharacterized protein PTSG_03025 [Salpingoeca rosetta]EGD82360.1 hypothetical protein PTSG_03025 [Salpingoeca rosetta]|eukprot:XP_004996543.1 hypothetical protein PTSG_03025 [Salpingoeca rosetta]
MAAGRVLVAAGVVLLALAVAADASTTFPLFKQCDKRWGNDTMGVPGPGEQATVCREGCAMSCLAMALNGLDITLPNGNGTGKGTPANPGTLNKWLKDHQLYTCAAGDCNNLVLNAVEAFTNHLELISEGFPQTRKEVEAGIASTSYIYLAHVRDGTHFVLLTGVAKDGRFKVNDPGFNQDTYAWTDIVDMIVYRVVPPAQRAQQRTPLAYPLFKQCNASWGSDVMVHETICQVGCLMSSVSMGLRGHSVLVAGTPSNPGVLNAWLRKHGGYNDQDDLNEAALDAINTTSKIWPADGMHTSNDLDPYTIRAFMLQGRSVVVNVMHGRHFVLATGWLYNSSDPILVNDPGFNTTAYSHANDAVGYRIFDFADHWPRN